MNIEITSIYGAKERQPLIHLKWGEMEGSLTIPAARAHAVAILESAEAAIGDAFLFEYAAQLNPDNPDGAGAVLMSEFREWRQKRGFGGNIDATDRRKGRKR